MEITMKKMVITGVNGFIGRHAKEYFEKEYEITGLDLAANYSGEREPDDTMTYYQCNMSQESAEMAAIFTGVQPDVILHCAGSANVSIQWQIWMEICTAFISCCLP